MTASSPKKDDARVMIARRFEPRAEGAILPRQ
jgi:hypothetical protein